MGERKRRLAAIGADGIVCRKAVAPVPTAGTRAEIGIEALSGMDEGALAALARQVDHEPEERDAPLCFSFALRRSHWDSAAWPPHIDPNLSDTWAYNACVRSLLACALRALLRDGGWFSCSRSKTWWSKKNRFKAVPYSYDLVMRALDWLMANGLLEEVRAAPFDHLITGLQSKYRATELAVTLFPAMEFERVVEFQELRIRGRDLTLMAVPDTDETRQMRLDMREINAWTASAFTVNLPASYTPHGDSHVRYISPKTGAVCYVRWDGTVRYYRQFCRGRLPCGGRAYSDFQNLPESMRSGDTGITFTVDGVTSATVEVDVKCQHARMLAARGGFRLGDRDPYRLDIRDEHGKLVFDRDDHGKPAFHIAVNSKGWLTTVCAIKRNSEKRAKQQGRPELALTFRKAAWLLRALKEANPDMKSAFASDAGVGLQRDDSEIALRIVRRCMAAGVPVLMVHDSFIVRVEDEAFIRAARDAEMAAYEDRHGARDPQPAVPVEDSAPEVVPKELPPQSPVSVGVGVGVALGLWKVVMDTRGPLADDVRKILADPGSISRVDLLRRFGWEGLRLVGEEPPVDTPDWMEDRQWRAAMDRLYRPRRATRKPAEGRPPARRRVGPTDAVDRGKGRRRTVAAVAPPSGSVAARILSMFPGSVLLTASAA